MKDQPLAETRTIPCYHSPEKYALEMCYRTVKVKFWGSWKHSRSKGNTLNPLDDCTRPISHHQSRSMHSSFFSAAVSFTVAGLTCLFFPSIVRLSQQTFLLVIAGKTQVQLMTLTTAALCSGVSVQGPNVVRVGSLSWLNGTLQLSHR